MANVNIRPGQRNWRLVSLYPASRHFHLLLHSCFFPPWRTAMLAASHPNSPLSTRIRDPASTRCYPNQSTLLLLHALQHISERNRAYHGQRHEAISYRPHNGRQLRHKSPLAPTPRQNKERLITCKCKPGPLARCFTKQILGDYPPRKVITKMIRPEYFA